MGEKKRGKRGAIEEFQCHLLKFFRGSGEKVLGGRRRVF